MFDLLATQAQIEEAVCVCRYPKIRDFIAPALAGRLINEVRRLAIPVRDLRVVTAWSDPNDNYRLAMAAAGKTDFLVTGDQRDLLNLRPAARGCTLRQQIGRRQWARR